MAEFDIEARGDVQRRKPFSRFHETAPMRTKDDCEVQFQVVESKENQSVTVNDNANEHSKKKGENKESNRYRFLGITLEMWAAGVVGGIITGFNLYDIAWCNMSPNHHIIHTDLVKIDITIVEKFGENQTLVDQLRELYGLTEYFAKHHY